MALRALTAGLVCGIAFCLQACTTAAPPAENPLMARPMSEVRAPEESFQMNVGENTKAGSATVGNTPVTKVRPVVASDGKLTTP